MEMGGIFSQLRSGRKGKPNPKLPSRRPWTDVAQRSQIDQIAKFPVSKKAFAGFVDHPDGGASVCKRYGEPSKLGGLRRNDNLWARQLLGGIKRDSEAEVLDALRSALAETNVRVRRGDRGAPLALGESGIVTGTLLHRAATALKAGARGLAEASNRYYSDREWAVIDEHLAELGAYADVASTTGLPTAVTGDTALHIAARLGSLRAVSALIGAGVDSTARNDADESAIVLLDSTARACAVKLGVQLDELRVVTRRRRKRRQVLADSGAGGTSRAARMREEADDERDAKAQVGLEFEVIAGRDRLGTAASACGAVRSACGARLDHIAKLENAQWKLSVVGSTSSAADLLEMEQRPALEGDCRMAEALQLAIDPETVAPFNHLPIGVVRRLDAIRERGGDASTVVTSASDAMVLEIEAGLELGAAESKPPLRLMPARELGQLSDEDLAEYIEDLENACAILQAAWRGHRVRRVLRRIVFNRAASAIQALVRGCQARQKFNAWFVNKSAAAIQRAARLYNERARARAALKAGGVKGTIGTAALAAAQGAIRGLVLGEFNLHPSPPSSSSSSCVSSLSDGEFGAQELDAVAGTLFVAHGGAGDDLDGDYGFR